MSSKLHSNLYFLIFYLAIILFFIAFNIDLFELKIFDNGDFALQAIEIHKAKSFKSFTGITS